MERTVVRITRAVSRASTLAVVLLLLLMAVLPAGAQLPPPGATADRPLNWQGLAGATAVGIQFNTEPKPLPTDELIRLEVPEAQSRWIGSGFAQARASSVYPGTSGTGGVLLACELGLPCEEIGDGIGQPFPPPYPFSVQAQYPSRQNARTEDGLAEAHASADLLYSIASGSSNPATGSVLAALEPILTVGAAEARTRQEFVDGELIVTAQATLNDVVIADVLRIGQIVSRSVSRADGTNPGHTEPTFEMSGVSVAGIPATITEQGLTVDEASLGGVQIGIANDLITQLLNPQAIDARVLRGEVEEDGLSSRGQASGLLVSLAVPLPNPTGEGLPSLPLPPELPLPGDPNVVFTTYLVTLALGSTGTHAFASNEGMLTDGLPVDTLPDADGGALPGGFGEEVPFPVEVPDLAAPGDITPPGPDVVAPGTGAGPVIDPTAAAELRTLMGLDLSRLPDLFPYLLASALVLLAVTRLLAVTLARPTPATQGTSLV